MKTDTVYIFPDTMPKDELVFPLVQFFDRIVHLRPAENDLDNEEGLSEATKKMIEQGRIHCTCPAPLGADRERFLRLAHDLQHCPDEYAAQLSSLALAGLGGNGTLESKNAIISTLLRQTGDHSSAAVKNRQDEKFALLWQARLVLTIGEISDRQEEELRKSLSRLSCKENELLAELRQEDPGSSRPACQHSASPTGNRMRLRLRAWSRLLALGNQPLLSNIFITAERDAFELLIEHHTMMDGALEAQPLLTLSLPVAMMDEKFIEKRNLFRQVASELLTSIRKPATNPAVFEQQKNDWEDLIEEHSPAAENCQCRLSLFFLPDILPEKFFQNFSGCSGWKKDEGPLNQAAGMIIGLLESPS